MKKLQIILVAILFIALTVKGQNLFFIGENSYPCTNTYTLQSNSDEYYINDLNVLLAKDGKSGLFGVSTKTEDLIFRGKIMIYLDDGMVIILSDNGKYDYVDKIASAMYYLTNEEISKMKNSNINTVRYTLKSAGDFRSPLEGNFSASNKGRSRINFPTIVSNFFEKGKVTEIIGLEEERSSQDRTGLGNNGISYSLVARTPKALPLPQTNFKHEGIVVVEVTIDRNGNVTKATPGVKGSTTLDETLLKAAQEAALAAKFDRKPDAPAFQKGTITYYFQIR